MNATNYRPRQATLIGLDAESDSIEAEVERAMCRISGEMDRVTVAPTDSGVVARAVDADVNIPIDTGDFELPLLGGDDYDTDEVTLVSARSPLIRPPTAAPVVSAVGDDEPTNTYDMRFFDGGNPGDKLAEVPPVNRRKTTEMHLEDARVGLDLFLGEMTHVLVHGKADLTDHQRVHLERITEFVQALSERFDRVR